MLARLVEQSFPGAPVLHAIGNHDTWPYYSQASTWLSMEADWAQALGLVTYCYSLDVDGYSRSW